MKTILVVEDDPVARQILHAAFTKASWQTVTAVDAMGALTQAQKSRPDLVILDLGLPAGGGYAVLQRLKMFPDLALIPVLVLSGQDRTTNEPKALQAGANAFLSKPIDPEEVVARARQLLGES